MEDPIDLLEKRVKQLELEILPTTEDQDESASAAAKKTSIINLYLDTHTMIQTALSCREVITAVIKKAELINTFLNPLAYLDPAYLNEQEGLDDEARRKYALELYKEVKQITEMIKEFKQINGIADQDLCKVTSCFDQLQQVYDKNANLYEECREVTKKVLQSIEGYNMICKDISIVFAKLEQQLSEIEYSMNKPIPIDED